MRVVQVDWESLGTVLAEVYDRAVARNISPRIATEDGDVELVAMPFFYYGSLEEPLCFSPERAHLRFELEYLEVAAPKLLLKPGILLHGKALKLEYVYFLECAKPGILYKSIYCRFPPKLKRTHLRNVSSLGAITIPQPLFGTFVENSLPELMRFAEVSNRECVERFVTLPFVGNLEAECNIHYLDGELEASLDFVYDNHLRMHS